jgi:DeoR/GlpR family transcriptional regulator of sugar metabolism
VRLRDLVQITGRPRETVRRKLEILEARGRLLRRADGYVLNAASLDPAMNALTVDGVRRFMDASRVIAAALRDAEETLARERDAPAP